MVDLSGVKVLVVDDEPDAQVLVKRVLTMSRASVITAGSAAEALAALRRDRPDILLSDIGMPEVDGYQLLAQVRQLPRTEGGDTPAVALTAFARSEDRRRALMAGFQMHLPKPVEPAELLAVVSSLSNSARRGIVRS
jgi:CheY-like chemotaxis protein